MIADEVALCRCRWKSKVDSENTIEITSSSPVPWKMQAGNKEAESKMLERESGVILVAASATNQSEARLDCKLSYLHME